MRWDITSEEMLELREPIHLLNVDTKPQRDAPVNDFRNVSSLDNHYPPSTTEKLEKKRTTKEINKIRERK